ncbi:hypothetical protein BST61_g1289 [Cercospora zeina]
MARTSTQPLLPGKITADLLSVEHQLRQGSRDQSTIFPILQPHPKTIMSSPTSETHPYSYQKPSTMATRSLVTNQKPIETPSAASHDHEDAAKHSGVLKRRLTNNYEKALASTAQNSTADELDESDTRPNLDRVQSFNKNDYKRELMQQTLASAGTVEGHGYHSTTAAAQ